MNKVSAIQNDDDASLQFAIGLASGLRTRKLMAKTLSDCIYLNSLERIGAAGTDVECQELLEFHSDLLLSHLAALDEVNAYHKNFPWNLVLMFKKSYVSGIMNRMKVEWAFVTNCVDKCGPKSPLYKILSWTRSQAYRECMMVAEFLGF